MTARHTPGPWVVTFHPTSRSKRRWIEAPGVDVAEVKTGESDAHLIASSPDLLAACEEALRVQTLPFDHPDKRDLPKVLRSAIARAKGGV